MIAFIVQAIIFGAGHAPYPNQPSYARPVELIIPSIGFGLLYLYWGLLPGIILHFAFDVVWFALPIFLANAPGIWIQQAIVVVLTLVPLWVVLWRRAQAGRWTELVARRTATPPGLRRPRPSGRRRRPCRSTAPCRPRTKTIWLGLGAASLVACASSEPSPGAPIRRASRPARQQAADAARGALERRGVVPGEHAGA